MAKHCIKCRSPVWSKGLCLVHWKQEYGKPIKCARKPIAKLSDKWEIAYKIYRVLRRLWMVGRAACEAQLPQCLKKATEVHHKEGKATVEVLLDTSKWLAVCESCHRKITDDSAMAIEQGLSLKRNTKYKNKYDYGYKQSKTG